MTLRRGFKTEANEYSRDFRRELGLASDAPLCPFSLASLLEVRVHKLSEYRSVEPDAVAYLLSQNGQRDFSAVTLCVGPSRLVIYNDGHGGPRVVADIAHELSHVVLMHPPKPPFDEVGSRHYDAEREEEANWLGPALLVSEEGALRVAREGLALMQAANEFGVSSDLMRMRLNITGAYRRVKRAA
jgi:Zn-dependent peptidase ImmA (M78 family)